MSSPMLHIKDGYFFDVPKFLWRSERAVLQEFPDFWVALDEDYLGWEAERFVGQLDERAVTLPVSQRDFLSDYRDWLHASHANQGRPVWSYAARQPWYQALEKERNALTRRARQGDEEAGDRARLEELQGWFAAWDESRQTARDVSAYKAEAGPWSAEKIDAYNRSLDGKILIPQPFGELRNLHEPASVVLPNFPPPFFDKEASRGFCISKFMVIEVVVALVVAVVFIRLANRMKTSTRPQGRLWNMLEAVLMFLRDEIARPAIGNKDGDRYVPLLWTIFLFILGLNLSGMVPWVGAPTGAFAVTAGMALVTFVTGIVMGSIKFGPLGFWLNQVPGMDLPWYMGFWLKPAIWAIEVAGMLIRHGVLGVRLLANMVAGHVVLLGIMGLAFTLEAALSSWWWVAAPISVVGSTLFSCLELFVAFLQAYIFTFLSALFIGAAVHHH
jgi:F-type H+-transporting ATPase subunit a